MNCTLQKSLREEFLRLAKRLPVAILGNGTSAKGIQKLLEKLGLQSISYDQDSRKGELLDAQKVNRHNIFIGSPSFLSHHPWVRLVYGEKKWYLPELDFASLWCEATLIAITGTNGKTTTTSFLTDVFNHSDRRAFSAGNIGRPLSELIATENLGKDSLIFCETSSFQAENLNFFTPECLIWTNFASNHLDHHPTLGDYFGAKYRLVRRLLAENKDCSDRLFCGESVAFWAKYFHLSLPEETHYPVPQKDLKGTSFGEYPQRENYAIIEDFCSNYGISADIIFGEATHFQRPKYRLENMGVIGNNSYWNDSKCTNFAALEAALNNFPEGRVIWIGGGRSKGENLGEIVDILREKVEQAVLIGETGVPLEFILSRQKISAVYEQTIENAIDYIKRACFFQKNIVFSPAFSSFDQFSSYEERGNFFEKCIFSLKYLHG
ncbi:MAG: UDP-N-acetylmuramoyl-L-alanine--D-glutamate ligase [Puniceicoccales bacterium]|nr:UDP-N-acetylmuramoyl-L-alanine--D-glutamate ligase [Puniceicoccales bacterium]